MTNKNVGGNVVPKISIIALALVAALATAAQADDKLSVGKAAQTSSAIMPIDVGVKAGIFAKHGLDIDLVLLTNQGAVISALVSDSVQIGTPSALAIIQASASGVDTVFIAATSVSPAASRAGIFVKNGSNTHAPADLIGKRIGVLSRLMMRWDADLAQQQP